jgi:hypothetical protein
MHLKEYEKAAKIMNSVGLNIPSYQRMRGTLNNLYKSGWIGMRIVEGKKEGMVWFLPPEIKEKLKIQLE